MLPSRALTRPLSSVLQFPAHLRASAYQHTLTLTRSFSASAPAQNPVVDSVVSAPLALLNALHATGLPWYAVLPTAGILVRGGLVYYLYTLPNRRAQQLRTNLTPLVSAHLTFRLKFRNKLHKIEQGPPRPAWISRLNSRLTALKVMDQLGHTFGVSLRLSFARSFGNFAFLIAFTEAIRLKCGAREGLLPLALSPFEWVGRKIDPGHFPLPPAAMTMDPAERLAQKIEAAQALKEQGSGAADLNALATAPTKLPPASNPLNETSPHFDPSMQSEGLPWCLDLSAPDPTLLLPLALFAVMWTRTLSAPRKDTHNLTSEQRKKPFAGLTNLQRISLSVSLLICYASSHWPVGVLLYFVPSVATGFLQQRWLAARMPDPAVIRACKRPVRLRTRKRWSDA